ncbi:MAG: hypothetical protein U0167_04320 [bacterium]
MHDKPVEILVRDLDTIARVDEPVTVGVPLAKGRAHDASALRLALGGASVPLQAKVTDRWSDGSVRWVLLDFLASVGADRAAVYELSVGDGSTSAPAVATRVTVQEASEGAVVETGRATFAIAPGAFPFRSVRADASEPMDAARSGLTCEDEAGRAFRGVAHTVVVEEAGPIRATVRVEGTFAGEGAPPLVFFARLHFFAGSATVRLALTVRNPHRAVHAGGLWELGDPGSAIVEDLSLTIVAAAAAREVSWSEKPGAPLERAGAPFEIYQDSSGGENWRSRLHLARGGEIPTTFRGWRLRAAGTERTGLRASPRVVLHDGTRGVSASVRHFWEGFPKAIEARDPSLCIRLFPKQFAAPHEIQGGEQKTHEMALSFGGEALEASPDAFRAPLLAAPAPETLAASGAVPYLLLRGDADASLYQRLVDAAIEGAESFAAKRERADEYGWRHFGEIWADHEARYHEGEGTFISHYNNQYDVVYGAFHQYARSGDPRWLRIMDELARHVVDVDVYHTDEDKPAYNHGLFWPTQHYVDGGLSTHRCYPRGTEGGGPDGEHNYTTGLRHWWLLTGNPLGREGSLEGARRTVEADDGSRTPFRWLARSPTGLASRTRLPDYHGPGRGAGNSITSLLDAWRTTGEEKWLAKCDEIVRRTFHPADDVAARNLLDAENRWSYTVHLQAIGRYLDERVEAGRLDEMYAWARQGLLTYARWMAEHERPTLESGAELEYPTETWPAQDLRKAEVFAFAALHSTGAERERFRERARWFHEHSLAALDAFPTKAYTRPLVLLMRFGPMVGWLERHPGETRPEGPTGTEFGKPARFVGQRTRAIRRARLLAVAATAVGAGLVLARLLGV